MTPRHLTLATALTLIASPLFSGEVIPLYPDTIPNSLSHTVEETVEKKDGKVTIFRGSVDPTLEIFLPENAGKATPAVVICPGGGYAIQVYHKEGTDIAKAFNAQGIAAFVLKYRIPNDAIMKDKSIGALQDAQQAIKQVRDHSSEWKVDPEKVGIMGFSAGGHLASTAGTHFTKSHIPNPEGTSLRPDFMILVYPVISMLDEITHAGSRKNLLGENPDDSQIKLFSNELQITAETPPTWLTHSGDDKAVPVANSIRFYNALIEHNVPAEMHLYPAGGHGFVLKRPAHVWMQQVFDWIESGI